MTGGAATPRSGELAGPRRPPNSRPAARQVLGTSIPDPLATVLTGTTNGSVAAADAPEPVHGLWRGHWDAMDRRQIAIHATGGATMGPGAGVPLASRVLGSTSEGEACRPKNKHEPTSTGC